MGRYARGLLPMLPPTAATLAELCPFADAEGVLAAAPLRAVRPLMPHPRLTPEGDLAWDLLDLRSGDVVVALSADPAGSEAEGVGTPGGDAA